MNCTMGNLAFKEETRTELIGGKVVMLAAPSTMHDNAVSAIHGIFWDYLRGKLCRVFPSTTAVYLEDGEEYQPDVKVVCDRSKIKVDGIHGAPDLVVEVLSPSTGRYDRGRKMQVYQRCGVREYWIVEPVKRTIEQYVLEDGAFVLRGFHAVCEEYEVRNISEERRAELVGDFRCTLFDDLSISVEDVFADAQDWG